MKWVRQSQEFQKMRKMTENFYGRLNSYSEQFDIILNKKESKIIEKLKINFKEEKFNIQNT